MDDGEEKKYRVGNAAAFLLTSAAVFFDALELLAEVSVIGLFISWLIAIFSFLTIWLGFNLCGVTFLASPRRFITMTITSIVEIIPGLDALTVYIGGAFWTIGTIILIIMSRIEDKTGFKLPAPGKTGTPTLKSAKNDTLKGNQTLLERQRTRRATRGLGESPRVAPTLASSRTTNLEGNQALLRRQVQRKGMDIAIPNSEAENQPSKFNLTKPEGYYKNRSRRTNLNDQSIPVGADFSQLNRTGERFIDESGKEKTITGTNYNLSEDTVLRVRGKDYTYRSRSNPENVISAEYDKNSGDLVKMHFNSTNPIFAGRSISDMVERIPPGSQILGGEVSMSTDSFPLLLKTAGKYASRTPGRFSMSQEGEIALNDQGRYSKISKIGQEEEKLSMINKAIDDFNQKTGQSLSHARVEGEGDEKRILIPKIKLVKNY